MDEFSDMSKELTKIISKQDKKDNGIFFTPKSYRQVLLQNIQKYIINDNEELYILEPSFGSGEFITDIAEIYTTALITGVEINKTMFDTFSDSNNKFELHNEDFIKWKTDKMYDLIIGNPPYVVVKSKDIPSEFQSITTGRPNLYCWFLYKCIGLLNDNGILAFIIPNSILNTSYYEPLRKYIHKQCNVLEIIHLKDKKFMETDQDTIGLIIQKSSNDKRTTKYIVQHNDKLLFSVDYSFLQEKLKNNKSLKELGFGVKTGSIVWNQVKDDLTSEPSKGTLLVYSSNFKNGTFEDLKPHKEKKQYVKSTKPKDKAPVILMHRGYGNGPYNMNVMLVKDNINGYTEFYAENHVNVIYPITQEAKQNIEKVYEYLLSDENKEYIMKFTGNGAMSKTEIETMLPVSLKL